MVNFTKTLLLSLLTILIGIEASAQSRKYVSQFSHLQNYYNPALTGYEGSNFRGFVRDQWAGFEGAPKTYFASLEFDVADFNSGANPKAAGTNSVGLNLMHDSYGAFVDTELMLSYASRIRISENTNLRLGMGVNYNTVRLDGNQLNAEQSNDPVMGQYVNGFANMQVLDLNIGMALTHQKFYVSYAMHNINQGALSSGDIFMERKAPVSVIQAGYRSMVTENFGLALNLMHRFQNDLPDNTEFNLKAILMDKIWLGAGHRVNYANNFQLGLIFPVVRIGYVYELPSSKSYLLPNTTHEFLAVFPIFRKNFRTTKDEVLIW
ncbi:membrane protein [Rhodonellum psychrophilum GCM71 = DSM 17998]|uniref:Membrane protein n=2 Tax=Rhodonellum TaxID=336827 RepID=U5BRR5_9BACT|nr:MULTISPECIES: PorP/SprF family type IX secretion system membrane protein [Rhodonellum]ERM80214.1 membrane protein [Rhodonellum psychrophilum GCM71 = DSM 17998]SDZ59148.1 type IX secretion system membrane protein, PorP/SprF family [Rhodonellum ikkaensis]